MENYYDPTDGTALMQCEIIQEQISQWLDDELPAEEMRPLFAHLAGCDTCRIFLARTKSVHDAAQKLERAAVPDMFDKKFGVLAMGQARSNPPGTTITISVPSALYSIGAAAMMLLFIYLFGSYQEQAISSQYRQSMNRLQQNSIQSFEHH